jgi:hypothetical protein
MLFVLFALFVLVGTLLLFDRLFDWLLTVDGCWLVARRLIAGLLNLMNDTG